MDNETPETPNVLTDEQKVEFLKQHIASIINSINSNNPPKPMNFSYENFETGRFITILDLKIKYLRIFEDIFRFLTDQPIPPQTSHEDFSRELDKLSSEILRS